MVRNKEIINRLFKGVKSGKQSYMDGDLKFFRDKRYVIFNSAKLALVGFSLASAHYFGYISRLPFEMVSLAALSFFSSFISLFILYFLLCYTISRVFAFGISQLFISTMHAFSAFTLVLGKWKPSWFRRSVIRIYRETVRYEIYLYWIIFFIIFFILFNYSYLKIGFNSFSRMVLLFGISTVGALFLKAGFLARSPIQSIKRLKDPARVCYRKQMAKSFAYFLSGCILALSFFFGYARFDKVMQESSIVFEFKDKKIESYVLLSSGSSYLMLDKRADERKYLYFSDDHLVVLTLPRRK